ncbi:MAG: hypothetical protein RLZZ301_633 [Bacteroidota bacterium]|jgi:iron complex transport system ATP-binding protein
MIRIQNAHFGYDKPLIHVSNLILEAGKVYALVGLNGSGKSTLLKTLSGQLALLEGEVWLAEHSLRLLNAQADLRAKQLAFVSSRFEGVDQLSVFDYIGLGRSPYLGAFGRLHASDKHKIEALIEHLKLSHLKLKRTKEISDGERQLVSLARAFVQDTPVLILDEPASFLDFLNREKVLDALLDWVKDQQKCVLFSSHDLDLCLEKQVPILTIANGQMNRWQGDSKKELIELLTAQ